MLPSKCIQPPCRNMEVNGDAKRGTHCKSAGNRASVEQYRRNRTQRGHCLTARCRIQRALPQEYAGAAARSAQIVTNGFNADGKSSLSGIILAHDRRRTAAGALGWSPRRRSSPRRCSSRRACSASAFLRAISSSITFIHSLLIPIASAAAGLTIASIAAAVSG